jgi:lysophospholipase L1-like esterase
MTELPLIIEMYGDSTTLGATRLPDGSWSQSPYNVPTVLQSHYGPNVVVLNKGVSGLNMPQCAIGAAPALVSWAQEMATSSAHIVGINLGINDANSAWETDFVVDYYLNQLIDVAQAAGKTVFIETANPVNNPLYDRLSQIAYVTRCVAQRRKLVLADHHLWTQLGLPTWRDFLPDGIHPNDALYNYKGNNLYTILNPLIQSMLTKGA